MQKMRLIRATVTCVKDKQVLPFTSVGLGAFEARMEWEMSAYFVSAETIADAAYALKVDLDDKEMEPDCIAAHDLDSLGRVLWQLNALALWELYGDREPLGANFGIIATYTPEARPEASPNAWQRLKSLQCLIYQCAEGTVPSTDLFKVMEHVENVMAMQLTLIPRISEAKKRLETMPEYAKASWGRG